MSHVFTANDVELGIALQELSDKFDLLVQQDRDIISELEIRLQNRDETIEALESELAEVREQFLEADKKIQELRERIAYINFAHATCSVSRLEKGDIE